MFENIGVINLGTYLVGALLIILLPGPNSLFVLATAASQGVKEGYKAACGVFVGDTVLLILTAAGAASVLQALPMLFYTVRVMGAFYLAYLGLRILWSLYRPDPSPHVHQISTTKKHGESRFVKALTLSLLNPKAILFLISFFVQFVDPAKGHPWLAFSVLGIFLQIFSVVYLSTLIVGGARLAAGFRRRRHLSSLANAAVGVLFLGFAAKMAFDR
ncbi:leucine efflux protein LeuE [Paenalcaligenes niemegkensis]|uniref:leucine efflux protein LeuE n=1 Tax=Paenalcaligenes niemegkensis TaxID=2895469 RepID=UPI001EE91CFA|nr:leucine efflux protein LeuE [Paenalcaligenes niemegkensis]MCQ9615321.1 leucine efflux protein LeuE [Paenalcaligenes niemegkensis]